MNNHLGAVCDDFYVTCRLRLKLEMAYEQEPILRFFERIGKAFPAMRKLRRREDGAVILEEEGSGRAARRWLRLDPLSLRFGYFAIPDMADFREMGKMVLEHAPYYLNFSTLNYDHLEVVYGFDLDYQGNHDQLLTETFWADHPFAGLLLADEANQVIEAEPYVGISLSPGCDLQAYVEVKSRTSTFEVRTGEYEASPLSVYLTVRKYWGVDDSTALVDVHGKLMGIADELGGDKVVPIVVNPLAHAIAGRA